MVVDQELKDALEPSQNNKDDPKANNSEAIELIGQISAGNREIVTDKYVSKDISNANLAYKVFIRLNARKKKFTNVSFKHCVFDGCYINSCSFDTCDFTGCRFIGSNFHQTSFEDCKFEYATFERCQIDDDILSGKAPKEENLRMRFARSLRMNYQQIGDARAVNKAINLELQASSKYLRESWISEKKYYRLKYPGFRRIVQFLKWLEFSILHSIWGNGESIFKLLRFILIVNILIGIYDATVVNTQPSISEYWSSILAAPNIYLGTLGRPQHSLGASSLIVASRLLSFALLTALLVKRLGRR